MYRLLMLSLIFVAGTYLQCSKSRSLVTPVDVRCDYLRNPIGIDNPTPPLFWKLESEKYNQAQSAYRVLVASRPGNLKKDIGDLWDSGKVYSDKSVFVTYTGKPLLSGQRVYWKVRVWDNAGNPSAWSKPAFWEMGLLNQSDWKAAWIGQSEDKDPDSPETGPAPYFRKTFELDKKIKSARVYLSGLGYYEFSLNGRKVGDAALVPAQTNYDRRNLRKLLYYYDDQSTTRVLYNVYDVTDLLQKGKNAAGVVLGNGWYNQRDRRAEGWMWYDTPRFILQLTIEYNDGTDTLLVSDDNWKVKTGPLLHDGVFTGNLYDARLEMPGWNTTGYDDSGWSAAVPVRAPTGKLESQLAPQDKVVRIIRPIAVQRTGKNSYEYDAGEMISGWARIKLRGSRGDTISLQFIEELGSSYGQKDVYICKGEGTEVFEPRFTWHAFRHIRVTGLNYEPDLDDVEIKVVNTAVEPASLFQCSNDLFNKIYENYIRTQLGNFHSSFSSDSPHRERLGYTGDGQLLVESSIFNFDMSQFYRKWINDMDDARNKKSGYVPHTAPFGGGGGGPAWGSSYVIVPWFYYLYYGDKSILAKHYRGMKQWVEYLGTRTDVEGIVVREEPNGWFLGDWATPAKIELPESLVSTSYYFYCADILAKVARVLTHEKDRDYFQNLSDQIAAALNRRFFNPDRPGYWTGYQGSDVFPLAFGIAPDSLKTSVFESLVNHVEENRGHLDTGILGTPLLLEVLTDMGREDLAFTIMNQWDFPGFGHYILGKGATTLWENWDGRSSHSHPMYGSVIRWFYKALAGINPDPQSPGFKRILLKPTPCGDLTFVKAKYNSIFGPVSSEWEIAGLDFEWDIEVPANTTATVFVPAVRPDNVFFEHQAGKRFIKFENNRAIYSVGSGKYHIESKGAKELVKPVRLPTPLISGGDKLYRYPEEAEITITASNRAKVYYTVDGSDPTDQSLQYSGPIRIKNTSVLKARAYAGGFLPSYVTSQNIRFVDPKRSGLSYTVFEGS